MKAKLLEKIHAAVQDALLAIDQNVKEHAIKNERVTIEPNAWSEDGIEGVKIWVSFEVSI